MLNVTHTPLQINKDAEDRPDKPHFKVNEIHFYTFLCFLVNIKALKYFSSSVKMHKNANFLNTLCMTCYIDFYIFHYFLHLIIFLKAVAEREFVKGGEKINECQWKPSPPPLQTHTPPAAPHLRFDSQIDSS